MSEINLSCIIDTRSLLLKSATHLFVQNGYDGTSIRQIAEMSGSHIGAVSYYFSGKEKLYEECLNAFDSNELESFFSILARPIEVETIDKNLTDFIYGLGTFCVNNKDVLYLMLKEIYSQNPKIKDVKKKLYWPIFRRIENYLLEAQRLEVIRDDINISFFVRSLLFIIQSEIILNSPKNINMEFISKEFMRICNRSIYV